MHSDEGRIEAQAHVMLKSLYSYWFVFQLRYVDNLHQRIKYNLLFHYKDKLRDFFIIQFMPSGQGEYSERTRIWMEESP